MKPYVVDWMKGTLKDALYWLTLLNDGRASPGDASAFLDSVPDAWLPTKDELSRRDNS